MTPPGFEARTPPPEGSANAVIDWSDPTDIARVRGAIAQRKTYRDGSAARGRHAIDMVQTHISTVFLTERYVFKFRRSVDLGFLDFRTLRRRRHDCLEELRLNRRLAPDVYLDIATLLRSDDGFRLVRGQPETGGAVADVAVVMKRLPQDAMLDRRIAAGKATVREMERIADTLARFHGGLGTSRQNEQYGSLETWRLNWEENFRQTRGAIGKLVTRRAFTAIQRAVEGFMEREAERFARRAYDGFVRDGHGDLRCEHICLSPRIRIIDCIEFNARFRFGDVANDLAFLLMDLTALGRPDLARALYLRYVERSGDRGMAPLMAFYACYRAYVRGKVTTIRLKDRRLPKALRQRLVARGKRFFALAEDFARQMAPPALLLVCGVMGTGKSSLAEALAKRTGALVFASDRIRKELAAREPGALAKRQTRRAEFGAGIYTAAWNRRTYDEMLARAAEALRAGHSVILDATFARRAERARAFALGAEQGAPVFLAECRLPDSTALARLARRERGGRSISDGRAALYPAQKAAFEPITELTARQRVIVDTRRPADLLARQVLKRTAFPESPSVFALPPSDLAPQ